MSIVLTVEIDGTPVVGVVRPGATVLTSRMDQRAYFDLVNVDAAWTASQVRKTCQILVDGAPLMTGVVRRWSPRWSSDGAAYVSVDLVGNHTLAARESLILDRGQERSDVRVAAIAAASGLTISSVGCVVDMLPTIPVSRKRLMGPYAAAVDGRPVLDWLSDVASAEQGWVGVQGDGTLTVYGRHALIDQTVVATFGGSGIRVREGQVDVDDTRLVNVAVSTAADRTVEVWDDPTSVTEFGEQLWYLRDRELPRAEQQAAAMWLVYERSKLRRSASRVVTADPAQTAGLVGTVDVGSRVVWDPPSGGQVDGLVVAATWELAGWQELRLTVDVDPYVGAGLWLEAADTTGGPAEADLDGDNMLAP